MIEDALNAFFTRASLAGAAGGTAIVSDTIDLGPMFGAIRNVGRGEALRLRVQIEQATTGTAGGTIALAYQDSPDNVTFTPRSSFTRTDAVTPVAAGTILWDVFIPENQNRYIQLTATPSAAMTGGVLSAALVKDSDSNPGTYGWSATVLNF